MGLPAKLWKRARAEEKESTDVWWWHKVFVWGFPSFPERLEGRKQEAPPKWKGVNQINVFNQITEELPWWSSGYDFTFQCRRCRFRPWSGT